MLRITTTLRREGLVIKLEGRLAGAWVPEAERVWRRALDRGIPATVDLSEMTYTDVAGRDLLAAIHAHGGRLLAARGLIRELVDEIAGNGREVNCGGLPCGGSQSGR